MRETRNEFVAAILATFPARRVTASHTVHRADFDALAVCR